MEVSGFRFRVRGFGFRALGPGFKIYNFGLSSPASGVRVSIFNFRAPGVWGEVPGFNVGVQGCVEVHLSSADFEDRGPLQEVVLPLGCFEVLCELAILVPVLGITFIMQSTVVALLNSLVALTISHRSCSVAAEPLHH